MRIGFGLPQVGPVAGPDAVVTVAKRAEELGYDDVWVGDRVMWPLAPKAPYPGSTEGALPEAMKTVLDPLETLTFVAAHTRRIRLGTSVINLPFYNPVLLARRLTTIDVLSGGRLQVGIGTGWSPDEFEAVGVDMRERGRRTDEALQVLKAIWTTDPVQFHGRYFHIAKSVIYPKPVQKPHPPLYIAAYTPAAMRRVAREGNGWIPAGIPVAAMGKMFESLKGMVRNSGPDAQSVQLLVRANVHLSAAPLGRARAPFAGSREQIREDIVMTRQVGADALHFDVTYSPGVSSLDAMMAWIEEIRKLAE